jgi:quercetin dioxygenase-like cupin family protein
MRNIAFIVVLLSSRLVAAQEKAIPVDQEPFHKVAMKNNYVEVMRVTIPPGRRSLLHTHSHNRAAVNLSDSTLEEEVPGKESSQAFFTRAGSVSLQVIGEQPFTHRIGNVGKTAFEVVDIELLKRPDGLTAMAITPPAAEDASFRAYRWALAPGASTPEHTHSRPYLIIAATPMLLAMKASDGSSIEHPVKTGDFHWVDGRVTHILTNRGKATGIIVEVELK